MQIRNEFTAAPTYWRMFDPTDSTFWVGVSEGVALPGQNIGPLQHPAGSFKLELKRNGLAGAFIASAGPLFSNADEYVLGADGALRRWVEAPPPPPPGPELAVRVPGFDPAQHGFRFSNSFPQTSFPVQEIAGIPITAGRYGLCGGMVYAVRDYFDAQRARPDFTTPPVGGPLFDYLWERLIDSLNLPLGAGNPMRYLGLMDPALADAGPPTALGVRSRADLMCRDEWPHIRATIDAGRTCPIALVLWKSTDMAKVFENHQVLVFGYRLRGSLATLEVYDPNSPGATRRITLDTGDLNGATVTYDGLLNPGARLWMFFGTDYTPKTPPDVPAHSWDTGWRSLGRMVFSSPDLTSMNAGHLAVFARGIEGALWWSQTQGGTWLPWVSLGGVTGADPSAVSWADGRMDLFARGTDSQLYHLWYANGQWSAWEALGGQLGGGPDACSWGPGRLDVFARGNDGHLIHQWYDGGWSAWEDLGGNLTSDPTAVCWGAGRIDVFARGPAMQLLHRWYANGWSGWEDLGGTLASGPDAASWGPGRLDVFVLGTDRQLYQRTYDGQWRPFQGLGGSLTSDPAAVALGPDRLAVAARGMDLGLWIKHYS